MYSWKCWNKICLNLNAFTRVPCSKHVSIPLGGKHCYPRPSVWRTSVRISFPEYHLSKYQWIFTKLVVCIDMVEIWFGIAYGQISSKIDRVICPLHVRIFVSGDNLSKYQWSFTKLYMCMAIVEIWFRIVNRQISSILTELSTRDTIMVEYYRFTFFINHYIIIIKKLVLIKPYDKNVNILF